MTLLGDNPQTVEGTLKQIILLDSILASKEERTSSEEMRRNLGKNSYSGAKGNNAGKHQIVVLYFRNADYKKYSKKGRVHGNSTKKDDMALKI